MIGDIPIVTFIITGILILIVVIRMWAYRGGKDEKSIEEQERELQQYQKRLREEFLAKEQGGKG